MAASNLVIGVAGQIGAGKTAVSRYLETECGFQYLRYSLVLAEWFKVDPRCKAKLQELGWNVMSGDGQLELSRRLIADIRKDRDCVVDGLRHVMDYESLIRTFGTAFALIYIAANPEVRFNRLKDRFGNYEEFLQADQHPVEASIPMLEPLATTVLNGNLPFKDLTLLIARSVAALRKEQRQ